VHVPDQMAGRAKSDAGLAAWFICISYDHIRQDLPDSGHHPFDPL
jgi:hypothetical protein